jgi:hypothetical protein
MVKEFLRKIFFRLIVLKKYDEISGILSYFLMGIVLFSMGLKKFFRKNSRVRQVSLTDLTTFGLNRFKPDFDRFNRLNLHPKKFFYHSIVLTSTN